jgi:PKD repeat protein
MKKLYSIFVLFACLFTSFQLKANEVTVKGYVKFANGAVAPNIKVKIFVEAPCVIEHFVTTNSAGFYTDKVHCEGTITKVRISIQCEGQLLSQLKEVSPNNVVEANFTLCYSPIACVAKFTAIQAAPIENQKFPVKFNSNTSETSGDDKIIKRTWNFGDGTIINEGTIDPTHNYEKPGIYTVCLTIKTDKGCSNTKCNTIEVQSRCHAEFRFEHTSTGVKFNSNISESAPNDPIVGRSWNFGDGSPILKGNIDPVHVFPHPGTYNVCLVIWTGGGCENKICKQVVIPDRIPECRARFSFERITPTKYRFNSSLSVVAPGDEIIERQWNFHDGSDVVTTHDISIVHEFPKPGLYEVCLKIKTAKGCESRFCLAVRVGEEAHGEGSIKIISLYPTPFHNELKALIYSRSNHILATISIIDVYGQVKWSKQVWLVQGNNPFEIPTNTLLPGPYFFRVVTGFGVKTKLIHKI